MAYTYDLASTDATVRDRSRVRLLIQDMDLSHVDVGTPLEQRSAAFSDEEIDAFLDLRGPNLLEVSALALRTWATNKQLIVIARKFARGEVNYGSIRDDMLKMAKSLEDLAASIPADAIVEMAWNDFAAERIILNAWARESL